jgi:hypothetical protein
LADGLMGTVPPNGAYRGTLSGRSLVNVLV